MGQCVSADESQNQGLNSTYEPLTLLVPSTVELIGQIPLMQTKKKAYLCFSTMASYKHLFLCVESFISSNQNITQESYENNNQYYFFLDNIEIELNLWIGGKKLTIDLLKIDDEAIFARIDSYFLLNNINNQNLNN